MARKYLTVEERAEAVALDAQDEDYGPRPAVRGDCEPGGHNAARPCPWVSCSMHLHLDVSEDGQRLKLNFPHLDPDEIPETCALDVADRGGVTLDEVGRISAVVRERVRQIEEKALKKLRDAEGGFDRDDVWAIGGDR